MSKAAVALVAGVLGIWMTLDPWPTVGWTTPNRHDADFKVAVSEMKEFRDEWKCDKYSDELDRLLALQDAGDDSARLAEQIRRVREKMVETGCNRFEEFG